ncbi:MAG: hypothetical protein ACLFWB_12415, partial [Armatimonadota bacterium]
MHTIVRSMQTQSRLAEALWSKVRRRVAGFLFASSDSDVDLLVVGDVSRQDLAGALRNAASGLTREINPVVLGADELVGRAEEHDHLVTAIRHNPAIFLIGDTNDPEQLAQ